MKKIIVGFAGGAQHGKDTCCSYLRTRIDNAYPEHLALADLMKQQATYLGWDGDKDIGGRQFLIDFTPPIKEYGNWLAEKYPQTYLDYSGGNYYTANLYKKILSIDSEVFFISDMRFKCEYEFFLNKHLEGEITFIPVRVVRYDSNGDYYSGGLTKEQLESPSENELKTVPMLEIINDADISALYEKLDSFIPTIIEGE